MSKKKIIKKVVITVYELEHGITEMDLVVPTWPGGKSEIPAIEVLAILTEGMNMVFTHRSKQNNP